MPKCRSRREQPTSLRPPTPSRPDGATPPSRPVVLPTRLAAVAEVLLYHHAQGLTPGVVAFADALRAAGHVVHTPDLYDGKTFGTVDEGVDHARQVGFDTILDRGRAAAEDLPAELGYACFSLGGIPAQRL